MEGETAPAAAAVAEVVADAPVQATEAVASETAVEAVADALDQVTEAAAVEETASAPEVVVVADTDAPVQVVPVSVSTDKKPPAKRRSRSQIQRSKNYDILRTTVGRKDKLFAHAACRKFGNRLVSTCEGAPMNQLAGSLQASEIEGEITLFTDKGSNVVVVFSGVVPNIDRIPDEAFLCIKGAMIQRNAMLAREPVQVEQAEQTEQVEQPTPRKRVRAKSQSGAAAAPRKKKKKAADQAVTLPNAAFSSSLSTPASSPALAPVEAAPKPVVRFTSKGAAIAHMRLMNEQAEHSDDLPEHSDDSDDNSDNSDGEDQGNQSDSSSSSSSSGGN